jgi:hypothetical protein
MTIAAVVVFMSEPLREQQGQQQEDGDRDGQHQTDQIHSRSTPRSTRASRPNSASVSTTNTTSFIDLHPQDPDFRRRRCAWPGPAATLLTAR